ncbi:hypothetical protein HYV30_02245 [Candidatus Kaiserbacteria bacterium]|nr:hypothetical protein [Candidatus Kaiserbacteria bacterium]
MGRILGNLRIPLAVFISAALIAGAFVLARGVGSPPGAAASAESALLNAIATRDSDSDGLPDWEEALYGTDANVADSFRLGMPDGEAVAKGLIVPKALADISVATSSSAALDSSLPPVPGENTLTAAFSRNFLAAYLEAKRAKGGAALSQADVNAVADQVLGLLSQSISSAPDFKTERDLKISGSSQAALKEFAVNAEAVLLNNTSNATTSELNYLQSALENGDTSAPAHIASIAKAYRGSALGLAVLPVPKELAAADLTLINSMMRVSEVTADFARVNTDPLAAMLALYQYPQAVVSLGIALNDIDKAYKNAGIAFKPGEGGASFVNLITAIMEESEDTP